MLNLKARIGKDCLKMCIQVFDLKQERGKKIQYNTGYTAPTRLYKITLVRFYYLVVTPCKLLDMISIY